MIVGYELMTVNGEFITVDVIIWRRYKRSAPGMVEAMLDSNPHLSLIHRNSPFIPAGTQVRIPIDTDILKGSPQSRPTIALWTQNPRL